MDVYTGAALSLIGIISGVVVPFIIYYMNINKIKIIVSERSEINWPSRITEDFENSTEFWLYGIHLYDTIDIFYNIFHKKLENGSKFRFLFADTDGSVFDMVKLRYHTADIPENPDKNMAIANINRLVKLRKNFPNQIELKKLNYLFPRTAYFLNPKEKDAKVYSSNHTFRLGGEKMKVLYEKKQSNKYDFLLREFEKMWDYALPI
jgi:hypothetical protein